jgi:hypothetical protein
MNYSLVKKWICIIGALSVVALFSSQRVMADKLPELDAHPITSPLLSPPEDIFAPRSPFGTGASYYHVAGSAFTPTDSSTVFSTAYYGCIYLDAGAAYALNAPLEVPDGARLVQLRIFYEDSIGYAIDAYIYRYNDLGTGEELISFTESVDTPGHTSVFDDIVPEHIVDRFNYSYVLRVKIHNYSSTLQFCGARVTYYPN